VASLTCNIKAWKKLRLRSSVHEVFQSFALIEVLLEEKLQNLMAMREQRARQMGALATISLRQLVEILLLCDKLAMEPFIILRHPTKGSIVVSLRLRF